MLADIYCATSVYQGKSAMHTAVYGCGERREKGYSEEREKGYRKRGERMQQESRKKETMPEETQADIEAVIALLDGYTQAGESRIKVNVVEGEGEVISRQYHHGRCDVGSPWACGTAFDVLE